MEEHQIERGAATTRYAAVSKARLPDDAPVSVADNATFRQLQFIDHQDAEMENTLRSQQDATEGYHLVRARIHGVVVPLYLNVANLRDALALLPYSSRLPFWEPLDLTTPDPAQDMEDVDHVEYDDDN
ncbi:hypothetical protein PF008_g4414 [Phytophthora fragariae]|uniref:Uncharacterized protein n=1 Tax=Phytophthora fragariae TaxID=53985 RepID=A0A6G0SBJ2_9STRA|nr:hypothetical protein PF008_g4414 [Phytophthora fragariae]